MLDRIREGAQGPIVRVILFIIIVAFALTGVSAYLGGSADTYVAKVNDREITRDDFERAYQNQRAMMEQQYGEMFDMLAADEDYVRQLRAGVLEQLIEEQLAIELAEKAGFQQSPDAIRNAIRGMQEFQINGQFDNDLYLRALMSAGFSPTQFRDYLAGQMNRMLLLQGALASEFTLPGEAERFATLQNQRRSGRYATISSEQYLEQVEISEQAIEEFYFDRQDLFQQQEQLKVQFVEIDFQDILASVDVDEAEVREYYEQNQAAFRTEEERHIAHILVEFGDDKDEARARIENIQQRLNAGESFETLAAQESDDTFSGEDGGNLGILEEGMIDPDIEAAGFALQREGDVSGVVESEFGFHLIKLARYVEPETAELADVEQDIRDNLASVQAEQRYFEMQQELARITFEVPDTLEVAAQELGLEIQTSDWLRRDALPERFDHPNVLRFAFSEEVIDEQMNSEIIEIDERSLVVRVEEYQPSEVQPLAEVRDQIADSLRFREAQQKALADAQDMAEQVRAGETSLEFTEIESVTRFGGELPGQIRERLFRMSTDGELQGVDAVTLANGDVAILVLTDIMPGVPDDESMQRSRQQLEGQNAELAFRALMDYLKANADIRRRL